MCPRPGVHAHWLVQLGVFFFQVGMDRQLLNALPLHLSPSPNNGQYYTRIQSTLTFLLARMSSLVAWSRRFLLFSHRFSSSDCLIRVPICRNSDNNGYAAMSHSTQTKQTTESQLHTQHHVKEDVHEHKTPEMAHGGGGGGSCDFAKFGVLSDVIPNNPHELATIKIHTKEILFGQIIHVYEAQSQPTITWTQAGGAAAGAPHLYTLIMCDPGKIDRADKYIRVHLQPFVIALNSRSSH